MKHYNISGLMKFVELCTFMYPKFSGIFCEVFTRFSGQWDLPLRYVNTVLIFPCDRYDMKVVGSVADGNIYVKCYKNMYHKLNLEKITQLQKNFQKTLAKIEKIVYYINIGLRREFSGAAPSWGNMYGSLLHHTSKYL